MNNETIKRFVRDYNLPISIYKDPYFSYLIALYDKPFGTISKLDMLEKEIKSVGDENSFLQNYYNIREKIICDVQGLEMYNNFSTSSPQIKRYSFDGNGVYKVPNDKKYFVSIDLAKANFQAIKYFNKDILGTESYDEFIMKYTASQYMRESKYLRQVIFGALNPKKQIAYEQIMRNKVYEYMLEKGYSFITNVVAFNNDEIICEISSADYNESFLKNLEKICEETKSTCNIDIHCEMFILEVLTDRNFFVKRFLDGSYKLKGVPDIYYPQVYKHLEGLEINDMDMCFYNDGFLCKLMEPIFDA